MPKLLTLVGFCIANFDFSYLHFHRHSISLFLDFSRLFQYFNRRKAFWNIFSADSISKLGYYVSSRLMLAIHSQVTEPTLSEHLLHITDTMRGWCCVFITFCRINLSETSNYPSSRPPALVHHVFSYDDFMGVVEIDLSIEPPANGKPARMCPHSYERPTNTQTHTLFIYYYRL